MYLEKSTDVQNDKCKHLNQNLPPYFNHVPFKQSFLKHHTRILAEKCAFCVDLITFQTRLHHLIG